jgi:ABC-type uncharacterized transport system fused permease/ATPase subunit
MQVRFLLATPPSAFLPANFLRRPRRLRYNARFIDLLTVRFPGARLCLHNMAVISLSSAQLAFGHVALLDHADFSLETGERVGLIGRNGTGKSSLLKVISGRSNSTTACWSCSRASRSPMSNRSRCSTRT